MKASIIIPTHNEEEYIVHTLRAVLEQDHDDFEVIVIDNASTDKTQEIVKKMTSQSSVTVVHEERKGTMWACEAGRKKAKGDIIVRLDADCLPDKSWLSRGLKHFEKADVVAVSGPYDYHDAPRLLRKMSSVMQRCIYKPFSEFVQLPMIRSGAVMVGGNSFMRADILAKAGGFNTSIVFYGDDTETAKRLSKHGRVVFDLALTMRTSARRFKKEGIIATEAKYLYHFFKHIFSRGDRQKT